MDRPRRGHIWAMPDGPMFRSAYGPLLRKSCEKWLDPHENGRPDFMIQSSPSLLDTMNF